VYKRELKGSPLTIGVSSDVNSDVCSCGAGVSRSKPARGIRGRGLLGRSSSSFQTAGFIWLSHDEKSFSFRVPYERFYPGFIMSGCTCVCLLVYLDFFSFYKL
jgi:hypothetical protein